jgi:hypothetical protein
VHGTPYLSLCRGLKLYGVLLQIYKYVFLYTVDFFKRKEVNIEFDWSGVSFYTEDPKYTAEGTDQYGSNVIFRSVFENKSNEPQTHSLKTERQTVASCRCSLTKGYTTGLTAGLEIAALLFNSEFKITFSFNIKKYGSPFCL